MNEATMKIATELLAAVNDTDDQTLSEEVYGNWIHHLADHLSDQAIANDRGVSLIEANVDLLAEDEELIEAGKALASV